MSDAALTPQPAPADQPPDAIPQLALLDVFAPLVAGALYQEPEDGWRSAKALLDELDRLDGREWQKKRATVLALVDARLAGRSEETIWDSPETCNRSTYHNKWKKDQTFAQVLANCTAIARRHRDGKPARALMQAGSTLQLASPAAVTRLIALLLSLDESIAHRAAVAILDRAGIETAAKVEAHTTTSGLVDWRAEADRRRQAAEGMLAEMDEGEEPGAEMEGGE